jgi:hypothetical protein
LNVKIGMRMRKSERLKSLMLSSHLAIDRPVTCASSSVQTSRLRFMTITLDTNCIIDVEMGDGAAAEVRQLLTKHEAAEVDLQVAGIVASERLRSGGYAPSFADFSERIAALAQRSIRVLTPIGNWDVTYWDEGLWADDTMIALEKGFMRCCSRSRSPGRMSRAKKEWIHAQCRVR